MRQAVPVRWDVDDRPPTLYARLYVAGMWLARDKQTFEGARRTLRTAEKRQRSGDRGPTRWTRLVDRVTERTVAGMTVWSARPRRRSPVARVVYVHGGGYVHPLTVDYWRLVRALASAPAEVTVPAYPLAPEATVDDVLPALVEVATTVASQQPELPTILMGDSAGGALILAMATRLRDQGGPRPAALVALSPWLDATLDEEAVEDLEPTDPMLAESGLRAAGRWWAGVRDPSDPLVSPVHADLSGLPPIDVYIGRHDILRPAVGDLADRADQEGADLHVHEVSAMFHVWMTRLLPEGRRTRVELARLVRGRAEVRE
jgi:monoterpene epsilon-lactone hydrolase